MVLFLSIVSVQLSHPVLTIFARSYDINCTHLDNSCTQFMAIRTQYDLTDFLIKRANLAQYHPAALTLIVLSGWCGEDWRCWPSYESIAARSGVSVRSTKTHIKLLLELGVISMVKGRAAGAAYDHNIYTFNIQRLLEAQ